MNRLLILLLISIVLTAFVFITGVITTDQTKYNNSFVRIFPSHATELTSIAEIPANRYSIAGLSKNQIFLLDLIGRSVLILNVNMTDTTRNDIDISTKSEMAVDSPYFFLKNGINGTIKRGNIRTWLIDTTFNLQSGFTVAQPITHNTFALRTVDMTKRKNVFVKSDSLFDLKDILQKQVDGILCTDGYLQYSKEHSRLIYLYRYRNQFLALDTAFHIQFVGKTIDTTSVAKISVGEVNGEIKMSKPPLVVNKSLVVDGDHLFVHSNLVARNELTDFSQKNSVIDTYNINDGSYMFSFYIPNQDGLKMQSFRVNGNLLLASFQTHIVLYKLSGDYF